MPGTDERVGLLEERMDDQVRATTDLRHSMELRFDGLDRRFDAMERRFDAMERRFEAVDRRFETVDRRLEGLDRKVDAVRVELDAKLSRGFVWLVGIQVTVLVAVIGALFGR